MKNKPAVSVCIPTCQRPDLLRLAIASCLAQTFQNFEILVHDDSLDTHTESMMRRISSNQSIHYVHNISRLGQAKNVNQLFRHAEGEFLVLLHDDDILVPTALEILITPLRNNPGVVASFGKQYVITHEGAILLPESEALNRKYYRTAAVANQIHRSTWSALVQQFPSDGYMVRTASACATLYRDDPEVGQACDAEFAYRLSQQGDFFFAGEYTSSYRRTQDSISAGGLRVHLSKLYFIARTLALPADLESVRRARLKELAPVAVSGCLLVSARAKALKILFGADYPWRREFVRGSVQFFLVFAPRFVSRAFIHFRWRTKQPAFSKIRQNLEVTNSA
jgi:glycosyltransferase involved in cell wall biosynthesis